MTDPEGIRTVRSNSGHKLTFDDDVTTIELDLGDGKQIYIDVAAATIEIKATAAITLDAAQIDFDSGGSIEISGGGTLLVEGAMIQIN